MGRPNHHPARVRPRHAKQHGALRQRVLFRQLVQRAGRERQLVPLPLRLQRQQLLLVLDARRQPPLRLRRLQGRLFLGRLLPLPLLDGLRDERLLLARLLLRLALAVKGGVRGG